MTQEDKKLLLKDLSARLPYGVKVRTPYNDAILGGIVDRKGVKTTIDYTDIVTDKQTYPIRYIKPYLRPMSSMTEEEKKELLQISNFNPDVDDICYDSICCIERTSIDIVDIANFISWLNKNIFDYRRLIEKGIAIAVTEENNPYKE